MSAKKYVYDFEEGNAKMKFILGGKGSNLAEMTKLGFPVPPGYTISTEACNIYSKTGKLPEGLEKEAKEHQNKLEKKIKKQLGDTNDPLLLSVRSGAAFSMPGMMDTVLNLGLNDVTIEGLIRQTENDRFAYDAYRRFLMMFSDIVLKVDKNKFERELREMKKKRGVKQDTELTAEDLKVLVNIYKEIVKEETGEEFPKDPEDQLKKAISAVFESWNNSRAKTYRKEYKISDDLGTAVNIQAMVFGNKGNDSATGVAFTRDPGTGENKIFGEYLTNAQGEDVVAGVRTPKTLVELKEEMPGVYNELIEAMKKLEKHYRDMQDVEFTIEQGKLYMLQTRTGKRTAAAALKIAVDMVKEGLITEEIAIKRIDPSQLDQLLHPRIDPKAELDVLATGLPASPGAASGEVVFDADTAEEEGKAGKKVILVRWETTPDDIHGVIAAQGVLTVHGGMTSHAAVVARGMGKPCVAGCEALKLDMEKQLFEVNGTTIKAGDIISIDGSLGRVILGEAPLIPPSVSIDFQTILKWADKYRKLGVRANADTPEDAKKAREFGAEGIGLCRTEHMFFGDERLPLVQQMILSETNEEREKVLEKLLPHQRRDFEGIFEAMSGLPVTIRLLDPPLHEFLPNFTDLRVELTEMKLKGANKDEIMAKERLLHKVRAETETNPMLGLRGCRLGIIYPGIYRMQVKAIMEAASNVKKKGFKPVVEIMIPLVSHLNELVIMRKEVEKTVESVLADCGTNISYKVGTMIELPRAALTADEIAEFADFFSFGTNDLTQTTFGFSRDDAEAKFLAKYLEDKVLPVNPFEVLDQKGVGKLIKIACKLARKTKSDIKLGICGEHGGEPSSIDFCHKNGFTYVSCSPFRVPLARLAAAQAAIDVEGDTTK
ncbi:pyruvate, phosphate dikinase [Candidatus Oleimmundimicrobium sp.]|uniref:pyruvate, phosphate dikinase n=1 Tax=Candidatus Oleimmundimicrobium sp. TaxID=3060597 RepID=UPI00271A31EC|nr:pyruvate, phosphate dikinase [Candidatus Oleimmundimicrobium sp.]MDO8885831.1 pyruvate, phosphate dikinase [Candidatus Oleimmundimicrobium sp.]